MFEPFAGATKNDEGTLLYTLDDSDLSLVSDDEKLRAEFEKCKDKTDAWELETESESARDQ